MISAASERSPGSWNPIDEQPERLVSVAQRRGDGGAEPRAACARREPRVCDEVRDGHDARAIAAVVEHRGTERRNLVGQLVLVQHPQRAVGLACAQACDVGARQRDRRVDEAGRGERAARGDGLEQRLGVAHAALDLGVLGRLAQRIGRPAREHDQRRARRRAARRLAIAERELQDADRAAAAAQRQRQDDGRARARERRDPFRIAPGERRLVMAQRGDRKGDTGRARLLDGAVRTCKCRPVGADDVDDRPLGADRGLRVARGGPRDGACVDAGDERVAERAQRQGRRRCPAALAEREVEPAQRRSQAHQLALGVGEHLAAPPDDLEQAARAPGCPDRHAERARGVGLTRARRPQRLFEVDLVAREHRGQHALGGGRRASGKLGGERRRVGVHGAGDDDVAARIEQPHEGDLAAGEPGGREGEQREGGALVAGECGISRPAQQRDLLAQPARTGRGARRREHATGDLGDTVCERDLVGAERLAAVPAAEDQPDGRPGGVAQRDRDDRLGALLALVRDLGRVGRDPRVIGLERGPREAVGDAQRPALHEARAAADRGSDHETSVGLGQRDRAPVAAQRLGGRPCDLRERAVDVDRRGGERTRGLAHLVELRGATAQDRAVRRLDLGHGGGCDTLDEPPGRGDELDGGTRLDARTRLQHRAERAVQAVQRRGERQAARDRARDATAEGHGCGLLAARIAQAVLERVERHVDGLAHRSEGHAVGGNGVVRRERGALEQHGAPCNQQRDRRAGSVVWSSVPLPSGFQDTPDRPLFLRVRYAQRDGRRVRTARALGFGT